MNFFYSILFSFFFFSVLRPFQDYFSSYETVGGAKVGEPPEKPPGTSASRTLCHHDMKLGHCGVVIKPLVNPGPSCSKLTTSLVNVSLKFQTLILQIHCYFLLKKCENPLHCIFSTKNNSVFVTLADICLTNLCLNDIVKLTML